MEKDNILQESMPEKKNKKRIVVIIGILALIAIMICIGISIYNKPGNRLERALNLGQKYLLEEDYEQAIVVFDKAIEIDPVNVEAYLGKAEAYIGLEEYEDSLECIDRLLELDSENTQMKTILTDCLGKYIKILAEEERYDEIKALAEKYGSIAEGVDFQSVLDMAPVQVEVLKTDIEADSVFNTDGYGSLTIDGIGNSWDVWSDEDADSIIMPQKAVVDREGNLIFPYKSTYLIYRVSDGIVSLTDDNAYGPSEDYEVAENPPQYYHLDGSSAFEFECVTNEYEDYEFEGVVNDWVNENNFWRGSPVQDGYAMVINQINWFYWSAHTGDFAGHGFSSGSSDEYHSYIVDQDGTVVCTLPEEFNNTVSLWYGRLASGFSMNYSLGWCGEGLFGVFEHGYDENEDYFTEAKGYIDFSGNMTIDLSGRGFTNLWPFHEGLAAVRSEDNMVGFIDRSGELVIPCIYENFSNGFSEDGICAVQKDGMWGYIDRDNNEVIPFEYDGAYGADVRLASVIKDGKCGLVDYKNRIVVDLEYDDISSPDEGVAYAIKDRTLYIITVK